MRWSLRILRTEGMGGFQARPYDCFYQMALDEALFLAAQELELGQPTVRFYQFERRCATIGFSQRSQTLLESIDSKNIPWVRRPTGGGAVFHDHDLIFSFVLPIAVHLRFHCAPETYRLIHEMLTAVFQKFGTMPSFFTEGGLAPRPDGLICFERPVRDDVMINGEKIAGGAERRSNGYLLHQGAIRLHKIPRPEFEPAFVREIEAKLDCESESSCVSPFEADLARRLEESKYKTSEWNWKGKSNFEKDYGKAACISISR